MTDQELKRLGRKDLLELLIVQGREKEALQAELEQANAALRDRRLCVERSGSIAEAALELNGVFEAAQAAAQQYLENIRQRSEQMEELCAAREAACAEREAQSRQEMERQQEEAAQAARKMEEDAKRRCQAMEEQAKQKADAYWAEVSARLQSYCKQHEELKELFASGGLV